MSWTLYRWVWRLDGPLFVGTTPSGALNRCRLYVLTRPLWGALTAELTRHEVNGSKPDYKGVGESLTENTRFSYLFLGEKVNGAWQAWLPQYRKDKGLFWSREDAPDTTLPDRQFRRRLLWTRAGTAIDPASDTAKDASLRETECIQPRWRAENGAPDGPVAMIGHVFFKEDSGLQERLAPITRLFLGGDTRYGLGRLVRESMTSADRFFGLDVTMEEDGPRLTGDTLPAHATADDNTHGITGEREILQGWDRNQQSNGTLSPLWTPGSQTCKESRWKIQPTGALEREQISPSEEIEHENT